MMSQLVEAVEVNLEGEKTIPLNRRLAAIASKYSDFLVLFHTMT